MGAGDEPFISVVTVCLNAGQALLDTARSVAEQGSSWEHVVKDGGSSDGSVDALRREFPGARVISAPDRGIYDAMNAAARVCTGRYLHFLNAGDRYHRADSLQALERVARDQGLPEVLVTWYHHRAKNTVKKYPRIISPWFLFRQALCHQAVFVRRDAFERRGGFDDSFRLLADHDLIFDLLLARGCSRFVLDQCLVEYQGDGLSAEPRERSSKKQERQTVRSRYYPTGHRIMFSILHEATLVRLRTFLLETNGFSKIKRFYYKLSNIANQ
jgi:glycosyltransferase involved in cell wall biosynthesis